MSLFLMGFEKWVDTMIFWLKNIVLPNLQSALNSCNYEETNIFLIVSVSSIHNAMIANQF